MTVITMKLAMHDAITDQNQSLIGRRILTCLLMSVALASCAQPRHDSAQSSYELKQPDTSALVVHHAEWAQMRDGVRLHSEVYLPRDTQGPFPVVLIRNPYNGRLPIIAEKAILDLAGRGYVVVNQDCRGTALSEGVMTPFLQEQNDGYDAVEWASAQPWSNGKVGLWGGSYLGVTAMQAAIMRPPHLISVVSLVTASDYHDNWTYANGVFDQWFAQSWLPLWAHNDAYLRQLLKSGVPFVEAQQRAKGQRDDTGAKLPEWIKQVPLDKFVALDDSVPFYYEWLTHPNYDQFWSDIDLEKHYADITVPVLMIGGWYDIFSVGTVKNFLGVKSHGGSAAARDQTKLVMAAICHGACNDAVKFGMNLGTFLSLNPEWWDYWLKGIDTGVARDPAVKLFVMVPPQAGDRDGGYWITANEYPLPGTSHTRFYLESRGHANTRNGDGILTLRKPAVRRADRFIYDPRNPVPTLGGNLCCDGELTDSDVFDPATIRPGISDQSEIELRDDILVYTSAPLTKDLTAIGPVSVEFWAASSAPDTDFTAKLVDVRPDGTAYNILDRVINGRLRQGSKSQPQPMSPGRAYNYHLDLGDTAIVFKAGNRIRIDISSSNFPHFARNPNTGRPAAKESELRSARQALLHDAKHPSYLELPAVEGAPDAPAPK